MAFQLSPGVLVTEKDLTSIVPAVATSTGAFVGAFSWGPVMEPTLISSENELVALFGEPNNINYASFFSAANFLSYTNSLYNTRVVNANAYNAVSAQVGALKTASVSVAGTGFTDIPTVTISGGAGSGGTATATLKVVTATITAGQAGTGWAVNDTFTINIGSGTEATFKVDTVTGGGVVTAVSVVGAGDYADIIAGSLTGVSTSNTKVGGNGIGLQITVALGLNTVSVSGGNYTAAPSLSAGSGSTIDTVTLVTGSSAIQIGNSNVYEQNYASGAGTVGEFAAKYPGALANGVKISMADAGTYSGWAYASEFDGAPGTSPLVLERQGSNDELHIIVIDGPAGLISGTPNGILEKFAFVSKASDARTTNGTNNYYKDVVNTTSKYVWWMDHKNPTTWGSASAATTFTSLASQYTVELNGGSDGSAPTTGNITAGWDLIANADLYDVSLLITGAATPEVSKYVIQIAESRKDCVAFVSPADANGAMLVDATSAGLLTKTLAFRTQASFNVNSSYGVLDSGWKYQYDRYKDVYRWIPLNGDIAGLCARTDLTNDAWWSPGGLNRGQVKNVVKTSFMPNQAQRDQLYKSGINPVVTFPGQGTVLYGDKTLLTKPSAFDRINVRRLFIVLEKAIATAAKFQLFEFNDPFTRAQFRSLVEPFLRDVQGRRGVTDFRVVCDERNNTGQVVDRNEFVADIFIKPARSINFITLNFIAARTGISFDEIGG